MSYTWEEVMLNIDVRNEAEKERQQQQDILDEQAAEDKASSMWSLGLSLVGGALFGPAGYAAGKIIGRGVGDITHDWEDMAVDTGKFYKKDAEQFKKTRDKAATDQTQGQIFNAVTDLATMYVQAGGLEEGFEGWSDLTTFGTGEDAWTVFGAADKTGVFQGTGDYSGIKIPGMDKYVPLARTLPGDQSLFSSWEKGAGFLKNLKPVGQKLKSANTGVNTLNTLYQSFLSSEEEKAAS